MKINQKEKDIIEWIDKVSKLRPELGGYAVCPYAKNSKYKIIECSVYEIIPVLNYDVIIFIIEDHLTLEMVQNWVEVYNEEYPEWKFFEDCKDYDTYINGIQTNNQKYNLILAQPKEKLRKFREKLAKTSYYNNWDDDYLKEILQDDYDILNKG